VDDALEVPTLPLDGESPCCPAWSHPSDLVRDVEQGMYCERAHWELFGFVLVVEAGCMNQTHLRFFGNERRNTLLIIYYPFTDSQLDFVDLLLADLKLQTQIKDSNKGAEMLVVALIRKAMLKHSGGNEQ